jgi:transcriptional regulator with XRE-family HTH domain
MAESEIGSFIQKRRQRLGLGLRTVATEAHVDHSWLSKVERGIYNSPDPHLLQRVARVLGIDAADIFIEAGYADNIGLPGFAPYLRAKYALPPQAIEQLEAHFELLNEKHQQERGGGS